MNCIYKWRKEFQTPEALFKLYTNHTTAENVIKLVKKSVNFGLRKGQNKQKSCKILSPYNIFGPSVQISCSVMSDSLWLHGLQHARPPCPSPTPGVYSNSFPLSWWCHPTILSSVVPFSSHLQSFPASGSFLMSQLFASGGWTVGVSASASVLQMNIQDQLPLGWTGWILQSKRLSRVVSNTSKASILQCSAFFIIQVSHPYLRKNHSLD